jgi:hypothetical protein
MNRPGFLIPVLALAALFFGWRTYEAWTGPVGASGKATAGQAPVPVGIAADDAPQAIDLAGATASIAARPLFRPDRLPFREGSAVVPKRNYETELSRFTLLGVLILGTDRKGVVVGKTGAGAGREERWEVSPGESLPGFEVKDVRADGMTLVADEMEFLLPLYAGGPKGAAGAVRTDVGPPRQAAPGAQPPPKAQADQTGQPGQAGIVRSQAPPAQPTPAARLQRPITRDFRRDRTQPRNTPGRR